MWSENIRKLVAGNPHPTTKACDTPDSAARFQIEWDPETFRPSSSATDERDGANGVTV